MQPPTPQRLAELESLAALLDGRLAGEQRERALASLDFNEDDQELLADAMAVMGEFDADDLSQGIGCEGDEATVATPKVDNVRPMSRSKWLHASWLAAAASLVVALGLWVNFRSTNELLIPPLDYTLVKGELGPTWGPTRGVPDPLEAFESSRQGSLHADLVVALNAGDLSTTNKILGELSYLFGSTPEEPDLYWTGWYGFLEADLKKNITDRKTLLAHMSDPALKKLETPSFRKGYCLRMALLAAIARADAFFVEDSVLDECPALQENGNWPVDTSAIDFDQLERSLRTSLEDATRG